MTEKNHEHILKHHTFKIFQNYIPQFIAFHHRPKRHMHYLYRRRGNIGYFICRSLNGIIPHGFSTKLPLMGGRSPAKRISRQKQKFCEALKIDIHSLLPLPLTM